MDEVVVLARRLGKRIGEELHIPVYCYEHAAFHEKRRNLASVREGEYEGLRDKLRRPEWKPDFGPAELNARAGATAVGARDFLVAYNVNLNTTSTRRANAIAFDIRERGRTVLQGDGDPVTQPGTLKSVKAVGWYIEEYGIAQISINLTNLAVTPLHVAFDECCRRAEARGVRVTGSELVGMIPLRAMLDAGRHFLRKQQRSLGVSDDELLKIAVRSLGLSDLRPFRPDEKIIEYAIAARRAKKPRRLADLPLRGFVEETASESPAPGGGSVAAAVGALGSALGTMVANLSAHKRGWDDRWEEFSDWAEKGKRLHVELVRLIDEDTLAFNAVLAASRLPQGGEAEKAARHAAVQAATRCAAEVPLRVMEAAYASMEVIRAMAERGNPSSVTDAGVGALCARAALLGASLNVRINCAGLEDVEFVQAALARAGELEKAATDAEREILRVVSAKTGVTAPVGPG
jgi:glutamate formiminotransferase/formiminotetrahydrofolate cyclodeaminase